MLMRREEMMYELNQILNELHKEGVRELAKSKWKIRKLKRLEKKINTERLELYQYGWIHIKPEEIPKGLEMEFLILLHKYGEWQTLNQHDLRTPEWLKWFNNNFPEYYVIFLEYAQEWRFEQIPLKVIFGYERYHSNWDYS